jgi:hypothetical protein
MLSRLAAARQYGILLESLFLICLSLLTGQVACNSPLQLDQLACQGSVRHIIYRSLNKRVFVGQSGVLCALLRQSSLFLSNIDGLGFKRVERAFVLCEMLLTGLELVVVVARNQSLHLFVKGVTLTA